MRTAGEAFDDGMEAGGADVDENFAGAGIGFRERLIPGWLAQDIDDSSVHRAPPGKTASVHCITGWLWELRAGLGAAKELDVESGFQRRE